MGQLLVPACPLCGAAAHAEVVRFAELAFVRCAGCGLLYKREQVADLGRGYEAAYFERGGAAYLRRWAHRVRTCRRQLLAALEYAPRATTVLDVGCSAGYLLEAARTLGLAAAGVDASHYAVDLCRQRGFRAEVGALEALPFPDGTFDVVTAKHTLEHTSAPLQALAEMRRVLQPGGVVFLVVPDASHWLLGWFPRRGSAFRPDRLGWQHAVYYSDQTLAAACRRAGLEPVLAGKAVFRSRLAAGWRRPWELARWWFLVAWTRAARALRLRREIQLMAVRR
jgi:SAM-dependent methyltransferase